MDNDSTPTPRKRSKAEERMIRIMTTKGGKGFHILRSAETGLKHYSRAIKASSEESKP